MKTRTWYFTLLFLLVTSTGWAAELGFIFWYPGEAGTTAQAQPILYQFAALLAKHTPGTTWRPQYIPSEERGMAFIKGQKPAIGIVSYLMYWKHRDLLGMKALASTRPLRSSIRTLALVEGPCTQTGGAALLFGSEPYPLRFLHEVFAGSEDALRPWPSGSVSNTNDMRATLKQMAESGSCNRAVLSGAESASLKGSKAVWASSIKILASSRPIPVPPVVAFGSQAIAQQVSQALLTLGRDPDAKEILSEMRLAGFAPFGGR